ncbi:MAG: leucine-rich repeat domain-containing protein, partial [Rikenellaceae bacterium]
TIEMLTDAKLTNFTESINPLTVWTMQLIAGDESLQFAFLDKEGEEIALNATYDSSTQIFTVPEHTLRHETLGIEYISSEVADEDKLKWSVQSYTSPALTESAEGYYLYAKCAKVETANTANVFLLSDTGIAMEEVDGYYHFLVGILNPESEGGRSFAEMYGYTEILPGQIRTNKVVSNDGQSFFDMLNNALKLGSKLQYNIDGTGELRIIGTIVQSLSGAESYLGTYRGEYSSLVKYYQGDSVSYTVDNITSTYQYINATATTGVLPTNTTYWALTASGGSGGDSVAILSTTVTYAQSTSGETPPTDGWSESIPAMTSGNYLWTRTIIDYSTGDDTTSYSVARWGIDGDSITIVSTSIMYNRHTSGTVTPTDTWTSTIPEVGEGEYLWTRTIVTYSDGVSTTTYSVSRQGEDGDSVTIESTTVTYAQSTSGTTAPTTGWSSTVPTMTAGNYLWTRIVVDYSTGDDTTSYSVTRWGVDGSDGTDYEWIFTRTTGSTTPTTPSTSQTDDYVPSKWTDDMQGVTSVYQYEWASKRSKVNGVWSVFSTPALWSKYAVDGDSITIVSTSIMYNRHTSGTVTPTDTWTSTIPEVGEGEYLWTRTIVTYSDGVSTTAYSVSRQGVDGVGTNGRGIDSITNYYLASSLSSGVSTSTSGWTTAVQTASSTKPYLWNYERIYFDDGTYSNTTPSIIGNYASDGAAGKGISTIVEYYAINDSTTAPASGWTTSVQTPTSTDRYLWNYEVITYTDNTSTTTSKRIIGVYGETGADGVGVYQIYKRAKSQPSTPSGTAYPPEGWSTSTDSASVLVYAISFSTSWTPSSSSYNTFGSYFEFCDYEGKNTSSVATVDTKFYKFKDGVDNTTIPSYAFQGTTSFYGMTSIEIPDTVTSIGSYAFFYQQGLTEVIFPPSVVSLSTYAFRYCTGLESVRFYGDVATISSGAFYQSGLIKVELLNVTSVPTLGSSSIPSSTNLAIYVPSSLVESFSSAFYWSSLASYLVSSDTGYENDYEPTISLSWLLWASIANITDGSIASWGAPYQLQGADGADGAQGPIQIFRGEYDYFTIYYGNSTRVDIVKYNSVYYMTKTTAGSFSGSTPSLISTVWIAFGGSYESIATGLLFAEKAVVENLVVRELETSSGKVKIEDDGSITAEDAKITGSLTQPYKYLSSGESISSTDFTDNVIYYSSSGEILGNLPIGTENNGRLLRIIHGRNESGTLPEGWVQLGRYNLAGQANITFYERDASHSYLMISREIVELLGYGHTSTQGKWIVLNRTNVEPNHRYGLPMRILALGLVLVDNDAITSQTIASVDGRTFTVTRTGEGKYTVRVTDYGYWGDISTLMVACQAVDSSQRYVTVLNASESTSYKYWYLGGSDDESNNDTGFYIHIYSTLSINPNNIEI